MDNQKIFIDLISIILIGLFLVRNTEITNSNLLIILLIILLMLNMNELYNSRTCQENFNKEPCSLTDLQKLFDNYMEKKESFEQVQKPAIQIGPVQKESFEQVQKPAIQIGPVQKESVQIGTVQKELSVKEISSNKKKMQKQKVSNRSNKKECCFASTFENPYLTGAPIDVAYDTNYAIDDFDGRYLQ